MTMPAGLLTQMTEEIRRLEAERDRLRGALEKIAADNDETLHQFGDARKIARAALAGEDT